VLNAIITTTPHPTSQSSAPPTATLDALLRAGFTASGALRRLTNGQTEFTGLAPARPGVYAFVVADVVHYVGAAQSGLRSRLQNYASNQNRLLNPRPQAAGSRKKRRLHAELNQLLAVHGAIEVYTLAPDPAALPWNGEALVNVTAGLELGLIRALQPSLNRYGLGTAPLSVGAMTRPGISNSMTKPNPAPSDPDTPSSTKEKPTARPRRSIDEFCEWLKAKGFRAY
jgi:hypothetical protein